jgi:hypothetical protein
VVREHDPGRLTYASGGPFPGFSIVPYVGTVDVMAFQTYPIDEQSYPVEDELQETIDEWDYVESQLAGSGQIYVGNPQAFAWNKRFPTDREARNVLYASLIRGAKGAIFYTFWGENGVLSTKNPGLWAELTREVAELKSLTPFLLFGARTNFTTGDPRQRPAGRARRSDRRRGCRALSVGRRRQGVASGRHASRASADHRRRPGNSTPAWHRTGR